MSILALRRSADEHHRDARRDQAKAEALRGLDLSMSPGEIVCFLEPNGAGKTTAIHVMLGLRRPSGGEVKTMNPILPRELVILAKAKQAQYEKEAERERLLEEARVPTGLRAHLALLLYGLAERLAPEISRFDQPNLARSKPLRRVSQHGIAE